MKLSGQVGLDVGQEFSLVRGQMVGLSRDLVDGYDEGALVAVLLLQQEVFEAQVEAWIRDHVHVRHEGEVCLASALGDVAHQVLRILQRRAPFLVF